MAYAVGHKSLGQAPHINRTTLLGHGFGAAEIAKVEAALPQAFDIRFVFNQWTLGEEFCMGTLGIPAEKSWRTRRSTCCSIWGSPRRRSTRRTTMSAGR